MMRPTNNPITVPTAIQQPTPSAIQPNTLVITVHLLCKTMLPKKQKSRRNQTLVVFDCAGLLSNGFPGRWPNHPLFSLPKMFMFMLQTGVVSCSVDTNRTPISG
jgi:hypothetical protein